MNSLDQLAIIMQRRLWFPLLFTSNISKHHILYYIFLAPLLTDHGYIKPPDGTLTHHAVPVMNPLQYRLYNS